MGAQPGAAGLVGVSLPYAKDVLRDLVQGARPRRRAVADEVAVECAVRGEQEADCGAQRVQMFVVIGGGVHGVRLGSEPLTHLTESEIAVGRPIQCVSDHGVDSRHGRLSS